VSLESVVAPDDIFDVGQPFVGQYRCLAGHTFPHAGRPRKQHVRDVVPRYVALQSFDNRLLSDDIGEALGPVLFEPDFLPPGPGAVSLAHTSDEGRTTNKPPENTPSARQK
jgi:hypothetical protein